MEVSKWVKEGDIVAFRSGKVIRCGGNAKAEGAWVEGRRQEIRTLEGKRVVVESPRGVLISGVMKVS